MPDKIFDVTEMEKLAGKYDEPTSKKLPSLSAVVNDGINTVERVVKDQDAHRLRSVARLINTFNKAILDQAGREEWKASDVRALFISIVQLDDIGMTTPSDYE
jgi:hypothetical protein